MSPPNPTTDAHSPTKKKPYQDYALLLTHSHELRRIRTPLPILHPALRIQAYSSRPLLRTEPESRLQDYKIKSVKDAVSQDKQWGQYSFNWEMAEDFGFWGCGPLSSSYCGFRKAWC
jgi:hypothetical protein